MRRYIFTRGERRVLEEWMESGVEDANTRRLFSWIRRFIVPLIEDNELMLKVIDKLDDDGRWHGRIRLS